MKAIRYKIIDYLPLTAFIASLFLVSIFYEQRMSTGIFKTDFYLVWITGSLCWLYNVLYTDVKLDQTGKVLIAGCIYILLLCFMKSFPDENSIYAFVTFVSLVGIVYYLQIIFGSKKYLIALSTILAAFFLQICTGYIQAVKGNGESLLIKGFFYNSGAFANYLAGLIPLLLFGFTNRGGFRLIPRIVFFIFFLAAVVLLLLTMARSAFIGVPLGCFYVLFSFSKKRNGKRTILVSLIGIPVFILISAGLYKLKPASALGRLTVYKVSANIIEDHPLLGVGPNRFSAVYNKYQAHYFEKEHISVETQLLAGDILEAYNSLLQVLVEYGIIGMLILICFACLMIKRVCNQRNADNSITLRKGHIGCIISIVVSSFFSNPFHATPILLLFAFHLAVVWPKQEQPLLLYKRRTCLPLVVAFVLFSFYYVNNQVKAESDWYKASESAKYDDFSKAATFYENAYPFLKFNGDFLFNYGAEACLAGKHFLAIKLLNESQRYNSISNNFLFLGDAYSETNQFAAAEQNYFKAIHIAPSHVFPKYKLVKLYKKWSKPEKARHWTIRVLNYPVKIRSEFVDGLLKELKEEI
jgi:O-antigen polymerase